MVAQPQRRWQFGLGTLVLCSGVFPPLVWIVTKTTATTAAVVGYCAAVIVCGIVAGIVAWNLRDSKGPRRDAFDRADQRAMLVLSIATGILATLIVQAMAWSIADFVFAQQLAR